MLALLTNISHTHTRWFPKKKIVERHSVREQSNIASTLNSLMNYVKRKKRSGVIILVNPRAAIFHGVILLKSGPISLP